MLSTKCPICNHSLEMSGYKYDIKKIVDLWKDLNVYLSISMINEMKEQADYTSLYNCPNCRLGMYYPAIIGSSRFYEELQIKMQYYEEDKWDFNEALKDINASKKIIEIGCGPGVFLSKCVAKGLNCYGTEYNSEAAKEANKRGVKILDESELKNKAAFFDILFCFHVLEHVPNPNEFIKMLIKLVKTGGKICISLPNQDGPLKYIEPCIMNMPPHHLTRWKLRTFKVMAEEFNLNISRMAYEPLLLSNHSYYSLYWANSFFKAKNRVIQLLNKSFKQISTTFFNYLINNRKQAYFSLLKGQSIYIVLEKDKCAE